MLCLRAAMQLQLLVLLPALSIAQTILQFGTNLLPTCAQDCSVLYTAQKLCVPSGGAPALGQQSYDICFCHSELLAGLSTNADLFCSNVCSSTDLVQIQTWFNQLCAAAVAGTEPTPTVTATQGPTGSSAPTTPASSSGSSSGPTWWSEHARWIAMVIVLIIGFAIIIAVGIYFRRRHLKKRNRASTIAPPATWGPNQNRHVNATSSTLGLPQTDEEKRAAAASPRSVGNTRPTSQPPLQQSRSKRIKKLVWKGNES